MAPPAAAPSQTSTRLPKLLIPLGDAACFVLFAVAGLRSHEDGIALPSVLRVALPFAAAWFCAAWLAGLYRGAASPRRVLAAWLPAWAAGLVLRALLFGRSPLTAFALIAMLFNAVLLSGWRTLLRAAGRGSTEPTS